MKNNKNNKSEENDALGDANIGAQAIGIKPDTLRKWARLGHVRSYRVRDSIRFRMSDLLKLISE